MPDWLLNWLDTRFVVMHPLTGECFEATYRGVVGAVGRVGLVTQSAWWGRLEAMWPALESIFDFYRP